MARNQSQKPPLSSKKMARQGKKKIPKKAPVVPSSPSESDAEFEQPPSGSAAGAPDEYPLVGSLLDDQPLSQASDGDRSPERTSSGAHDMHSDRSSSQERTSPLPSERNSQQSSRSSRRSSAQEDVDSLEEDLHFISHQPAENLNSSDDEMGATHSGPAEKFTAPQPTQQPSPRPPVHEASLSRGQVQVNSALLNAAEANKLASPRPPHQQAIPSKLQHPPQRNHSPGSSPVPPANDPSRPATVASRLPTASNAVRRVSALEDDDDDAPVGGSSDGGNAGTVLAAPHQHDVDAALRPSSNPPAKRDEKKRRTGSRKQTSLEAPAGGAPDGPTTAILAMLSTMQAQLESQEKRLMAQAGARERAEERHQLGAQRENQLLDEIVALKGEARAAEESQSRRERKRREREAEQPPAQPFAAFQDPEYLCRFEHLMKTGQRTMAEVAEALEATKERGTYSSGRADFYLKAKANTRFQRTLQQANNNLAEDQEPIAEHSKLGGLLQAPGNEDAVDIVVKLRDAHARARAKATHCSTPALGAGNLVNLSIIKNDSRMGRKGLAFLSAVAYAVCEDCTKCTILRTKAENEREWKARQAAEAESIKKLKSEGALRKKRLNPPFKPSDSRVDKSLPRSFCAICKHGWNKGHHLYYCGECNQGIHLLCTDWHHIRMASGGSTWFACDNCLEARDRAIEEGDSAKEYVEVEEEFVDHELAPPSAEAAGKPADAAKPPQNSMPALEGDADLEKRRDAPPPPRSPHHNPPYSRLPLMMAPETPRGPAGGETVPDFGSGNSSRPSYQVKDYFTWEMVPKDWAPKADAPSKYHPEKGYSRIAYQNWRRKNVTLRDQVEANNSSLGPLTRSFSGEMRAFIGKQFLKEPALSWLWPNPVMSEKAIDTWVATDPEFKWVEKIPDPILLELMDKRFGVKCSDLFLSRKFTANLPITDSFGDVNYHADLFNRWAGEWSTELMELQKAGVNFDSVDLKQTLLNAVSPYKVIHDKAVQIATSSANVLLAALCDWVIEEEEKANSRRNQKESLLKITHRGGEAARERADTTAAAAKQTTQASSHSKAGAAALMTNSSSHASGDQSASKTMQRLPPHLKANGSKVFCRGCSNNWDGAMSIPCYRACKYREHPDYFADCKDKEPSRRNALTWRGFRDANPKGPFPQSFLRWEEYEKTKVPKRPRDESTRD
jgi:hypothetical protein